MCLIAFAWQAHADYPLIVAGNRDEFFARPTAPAAWWPAGQIVAGRDLRGGGTWMGVSRHGRFAALTNHRDPAAFRADAPSRGEIVGRYLTAIDPGAALARIASDGARFNGFNLLAAHWGDDPARGRMAIVSHPGASGAVVVEPGIHALSNAHLDTAWPKVDAIRAALATTLEKMSEARTTPDALTDPLFSMLSDRTIAADERLPETGVTREAERGLSAAFIRMPGYGTRSSTVLLVDRRGRATFIERRCEPDQPVAENRFVFDTLSATPAA